MVGTFSLHPLLSPRRFETRGFKIILFYFILSTFFHTLPSSYIPFLLHPPFSHTPPSFLSHPRRKQPGLRIWRMPTILLSRFRSQHRGRNFFQKALGNDTC